jgi:putative ABC transport system ATP-binding protein
LQVISNGILLGIGGYLVIERQLTIGQLVAAELVISKILFDISKFGKHLESYYSLLAAIEKVDNVLSLPLIPIHPNPFISNNRAIEVEFLDLEYIDQNKNKFFSDITFHITSGSALGLITNESRLKNVLFELMTGCRIPSQGSIFMDKQDIFQNRLF